MDPLYVRLGRRIRETRRAAELTQEDLSSRVGLTRTSISNIERGTQPVSVKLLLQFAEAMGVEPAGLLPGEEPPPPRRDGSAKLIARMPDASREDAALLLSSLTPGELSSILKVVQRPNTTKLEDPDGQG